MIILKVKRVCGFNKMHIEIHLGLYIPFKFLEIKKSTTLKVMALWPSALILNGNSIQLPHSFLASIEENEANLEPISKWIKAKTVIDSISSKLHRIFFLRYYCANVGKWCSPLFYLIHLLHSGPCGLWNYRVKCMDTLCCQLLTLLNHPDTLCSRRTRRIGDCYLLS